MADEDEDDDGEQGQEGVSGEELRKEVGFTILYFHLFV